MNRLRDGRGEDREGGRAEDGLGRLVILPATIPNPWLVATAEESARTCPGWACN
jgi:hypothetical protein